MKKFIILVLLININSPLKILFCQTTEMNSDSTTCAADSAEKINPPRFYTYSNLLVGAEIIDPFNPDEFFTRATQLWKTDIRIGMAWTIADKLVTFLSIRDNDSPRTNDIHLYEAGVKIPSYYGLFWFGQRRLQAGNQSFYLKEAFDRTFWDRGLIYDIILRGVGAVIDFNKSEVEFFTGSEASASFVGGAGYGIEILSGWKAKTSALYIARDPQYSAFGVQLGIEVEESFEHFYGYEVLAYKIFDQEPSSFQELTILAEGSFRPDEIWELGVAGLFRRLINLGLNRDELRVSASANYQITKHIIPGLQVELFELANFTELQFGALVYLKYYRGIQVIPRIRYIVTEFGPDIAFFGIEGVIILGEWE